MSDLPPDTSSSRCTVPLACQISFRGYGGDDEWSVQFREAVRQLIVGCGSFMDLSLLDGVTVGDDYEAALASVDLGYESDLARQYTNTGGLLGVGKVLRVRRGHEVRAHVVFRGEVLGALATPEHELFWATANIVAHELAHVASMAWFEAHSPGVLLSPQQGDWALVSMRDAAHTVWDEYAACRLSAAISDPKRNEASYRESLRLALTGAMPAAKEAIKAYRLHGDLCRLMQEAGSVLANPLKIAAYLLGHLDGCEADPESVLQSELLRESSLAECFPLLLSALRDAWNIRLEWKGLQGVDGVVEVILCAMQTAGIEVALDADGSYVRVPVTPDTIPSPDEVREWQVSAAHKA
jgi:hypothetical protein